MASNPFGIIARKSTKVSYCSSAEVENTAILIALGLMVLALPIFHKENRRFSSRLSTFILYLSFLDPHMLKQLTECSLKDVMKTGFGNF